MSSLPTSPVSWTPLQITHNWTKNERPQLDGQRLVWQVYDGVDWEIESYDLTTGAITQLTNDTVDEADPQLAGDHLLWIVHSPAQPPLSDSFWVDTPTLSLYDFATGTETLRGTFIPIMPLSGDIR